MGKKWVYFFDQVKQVEDYVGGNWDGVRAMLGGKGANLAEMERINVPVPPGFTITTEACNKFLELGEIFPEGMWDQVIQEMDKIESLTGKTFGGLENPLLVSCRSGAKFSMPGMMDTVLNIGLNDVTAKVLIKLTEDPRFVYDSYRRLIQMFGSVVMGVDGDIFEEVILRARAKAGVEADSELAADDWILVIERFKQIFKSETKLEFPDDPHTQLMLATEAVFKSWNGKRAIDYRNAANIPHDLGTAVNIVTMVFGNMGDRSATGVAMTRNGSTGENRIEGDYLVNAQGEDVVAGTRMTNDISVMKEDAPEAYEEFTKIARRLEDHYRDMQDVEFTVENGKLWMLQTRDGKRTAQAAVRIAVEMAREGLITREEAVLRVQPEQVDFFLHPQFKLEATKAARKSGNFFGKGLNVSPGAAFGVVALTADLAEEWSKDGKAVIMVRPETKPDDVHGMLAANGILTSRGGRTSHAALVARQFGKPAVVGVSEMVIEMNKRKIAIDDVIINEGDKISIDGTTGEVFIGELETTVPDINDEWLMTLLAWADEFRTLGVWANADYPDDAKRARGYGAEGIGLCRTEHMFLKAERLPFVQRMIMADLPSEQREAISSLLPFQREDFEGIFSEMDGLPVIIRLIDPPLHEFLPDRQQLIHELADLKIRLSHADTLEKINQLLQDFKKKEKILKRVESLHETNPMLGFRGVRLGICIPELTAMQVRAIFEAACAVSKKGIKVFPKIMIPLASHCNELKVQRAMLEKEAKNVMREQNIDIEYKFGTMIEIPRAALTADQIAQYASFFSFGTNDLTQTTFGISRDDAEAAFLIEYISTEILAANPFATIDKDGVGQLMDMAVTKGRSVNPDLECGICGEHGGDPESIFICHDMGLNYVSCSPFRVPVARLAAAHAVLRKDRHK
ncbi:MAG: pyruvate, phosphate dikinase [Desulfosarcina sp.]|nr:pyruvate, phosphate dikinase [Desulfobacterales bacterium]